MSCEKITYLTSLEVPSKYQLKLSLSEELFIEMWSIVGDEVEKLLDLGWKAEEKGSVAMANSYYEGANIYYYMMYLALFMKEELDDYLLDNNCNTDYLNTKYKLDCIEKNLPCLSKKYKTDYTEAWKKILEIAGLDTQAQECSDCCVGIGQMIIDGEEDCTAFIIGDCDENVFNEPPYGEFNPCEYSINEHTQAIGDNLYNC